MELEVSRPLLVRHDTALLKEGLPVLTHSTQIAHRCPNVGSLGIQGALKTAKGFEGGPVYEFVKAPHYSTTA